MKTIRFVVLLAPLAWAGIPSNAIYLTNGTGSTVNQPYIISRFFAQGEIRNYPKPSGISQWQADVKTRWPDGTVRHALIAFWKSTENPSFPDTNTDTIPFTDNVNPCHLGDVATCTAAGLDASGMLNFRSGNWGASIVATQASTTFTTDARTMIENGKIHLYWMRGPIVTVAVIEDRTPGAGGGTPASDFGWKCSSVYRYSVDPATDTLTTYDLATGLTPVNHGLIAGQILALGAPGTGPAPLTPHFKGNQFVSSPSGSTLKLSATNGGAAIDFTTTGTGSLYLSGCGGASDYSNATWTPYAPTDPLRPLHPQFILTFFPGWSGVYIEYVMQNGWTTAMQDQRFSLVLKSGASNANTVVSKNPLLDFARTSWVYRAWDGTATVTEFPQSSDIFKGGPTTASYPSTNFKINLGTNYLIYSKLLLQYDPSLTVDPDANPTNLLNDIAAFTVGTRNDPENPFRCSAYDPVNCRSFQRGIANEGGRPELGVLMRWIARFVYSWDPRLLWITMGNGDIAGTIPYHYWESQDRGNTFDSAHTVSSFGRPVSVNSRPTARLVGSFVGMDSSGLSADNVTYVDLIPASLGTVGYGFSSAVAWAPEYSWTDTMHQPALHYWPYMLTGDYYYMEDSFGFYAQYLLNNVAKFRHNDWGIQYTVAPRGYAWGQRNIGMAAAMAPDSPDQYGQNWPEKAYFTEKLYNNLAVIEAWLGLKPGQGNFATTCNADTFNATTETNKHCWALYAHEGKSANNNLWNMPLIGNTGASYSAPINTSIVSMVNNVFMGEYWEWAAAWLAEAGFPTDKMLHYISRFHIEPALSSWPVETERYAIPITFSQPTNTLAQAMNSTTDRTILLSSPMAWPVDPPFPVFLYNGAVHGTTDEWMYVCTVSSDKLTLTVCSTGRAAIQADNDGANKTAKAHAIGDIVAVSGYGPADDRSTMVHSLSQIFSGVTDPHRSPPFVYFTLPEAGYINLAMIGLAYGENAYSAGKSGYDAFKALEGHRRNPAVNGGYDYTRNGGGYNPMLHILPRRDPVLNVRTEVGDTFVILRYKAPSAGRTDAGCTVDATNSGTFVSDNQSGSRDRWFVVTGLTALTPYGGTIHCDADYYNNGAGAGNTAVSYTTSAPLTGTAALTARLGPGPATAYLDYGSTPALGSQVSAECSSGCSLSATVARGLWYYRAARSDGNAGQAQPIIIR